MNFTIVYVSWGKTMTLPVSPNTITAADINVELGRAATDPFDINGAEERDLAEIASGPISFSDFWGKSAAAATSITRVITVSEHRSGPIPDRTHFGYIDDDSSGSHVYDGAIDDNLIQSNLVAQIAFDTDFQKDPNVIVALYNGGSEIDRLFFTEVEIEGFGTFRASHADYRSVLPFPGLEGSNGSSVTWWIFSAVSPDQVGSGWTEGATRTVTFTGIPGSFLNPVDWFFQTGSGVWDADNIVTISDASTKTLLLMNNDAISGYNSYQSGYTYIDIEVDILTTRVSATSNELKIGIVDGYAKEVFYD